MFPKWFDQWQADNPTNIFGPAIAIGIVGSAVFVAAMLIAWGQPYATAAMQTGPRGTGMHVQEFVSDLEASDPTIAGFTAIAPVPPTPDSERAGDVIENVEPLLADLTVENYERLLESMRAWTGIPDLLEPGLENYQTTVARRMIQMTQNINWNWVGHVGANGEVGVTCYTCHRGQAVPNNVWFRVGEVNANADGWPAIQNRVTMTSNFASLPSTYLENFLLLDEEGFYGIAQVHDLESRVENFEGDPLIQQAEMTYAWMNYFANSLGVNCTFCHNTRAFYDPAQVTPQWGTASIGIIMVQEMIEDYLLPLEDVYPAERLGPVYGDAPLAACRTCHQGYQQPLAGLNVIHNYPELAVVEGEEIDYTPFMTSAQIEALDAAALAEEEAAAAAAAAAAEAEAAAAEAAEQAAAEAEEEAEQAEEEVPVEEDVATEDPAAVDEEENDLSQQEEMMLAICQAGEAAGVPLTQECMDLLEAKAE